MTRNHENYTAIFLKWKKVNTLLQHSSINTFPLQQRIALFKRWKRYLKKMIAAKNQLTRAVSIAAIVACISLNTNAQNCNTYYKNRVNPLNGPFINLLENSWERSPSDFVDIDGDGDLDAYSVIGTTNAYQFILFKNTGDKYTPVFDDDTSAAATGFDANELYGIYRLRDPQFVDIDNDGDADCFLIGKQGFDSDTRPLITFFENTGTPQQPNFQQNDAKNPFGYIYPGQDPYQDQDFLMADFDDDGDTDLLVYEYYGIQIRHHENVGDKSNPHFVLSNNPFGYFFYQPSFYDWDKDGLTDMFFGNYPGEYFKNTGAVGNPVYQRTSENMPILIDSYIYHWVDLNGDGAPEVYTGLGYNTLTPASKIEAAVVTTPNGTLTSLQAFPKKSGFTYQWKRNGQVIPAGTKDSLYVIKPGKYTVDITTACGTSTSNFYVVKDAASVVVQNSTVVAADNKNRKPIAYPNPFTNAITIQLPATYTHNATLKITDMHGKVLLSQKINGNTIQFGKTYALGTYFMQIIKYGKVVYTEKIIKQ